MGPSPPDPRVHIDDEPAARRAVSGGPVVRIGADATTEMGGDYELNKAVLDRIMATIEFIGSIQ